MRLIDADKVIERVIKFEGMTGVRLDEVHDFVSSAPTVETAVLSTSVIVEREALTAPWCEQYVKDMMTKSFAHELVDRIEIRSFDTDLRYMQKAFTGRIVIVTGTKMDGESNEID